MANEERESGNESEAQPESQGGGGAANTALKVAAAAAATGAAAYAARKAVTRNGSSNGHDGQGSGRSSKQESGVVGSIFSGSWEAAREQLLPLAEDAVGAAGKYVARNGPEILRDRLVPRFISSFENARED